MQPELYNALEERFFPDFASRFERIPSLDATQEEIRELFDRILVVYSEPLLRGKAPCQREGMYQYALFTPLDHELADGIDAIRSVLKGS